GIHHRQSLPYAVRALVRSLPRPEQRGAGHRLLHSCAARLRGRVATLQDYRQRLAQELGVVRRELLARPSRPVLWLLFVFVCFEFCGMLWDQPGYYGWENDGAAPRGFFG